MVVFVGGMRIRWSMWNFFGCFFFVKRGFEAPSGVFYVFCTQKLFSAGGMRFRGSRWSLYDCFCYRNEVLRLLVELVVLFSACGGCRLFLAGRIRLRRSRWSL